MRRRPCAWLDADIDAPMGYLHQHAGYTRVQPDQRLETAAYGRALDGGNAYLACASPRK